MGEPTINGHVFLRFPETKKTFSRSRGGRRPGDDHRLSQDQNCSLAWIIFDIFF